MKKLLKKRHEISTNEGVAKNDLRIRNLGLFHGPNEIKVNWLQTTILSTLNNAHILISAPQRHRLDSTFIKRNLS